MRSIDADSATQARHVREILWPSGRLLVAYQGLPTEKPDRRPLQIDGRATGPRFVERDAGDFGQHVDGEGGSPIW